MDVCLLRLCILISHRDEREAEANKVLYCEWTANDPKPAPILVGGIPIADDDDPRARREQAKALKQAQLVPPSPSPPCFVRSHTIDVQMASTGYV